MIAFVNGDLKITLNGVYRTDAGYLANCIYNCYNANGLRGYEVAPDSPGSFIIRTYWSEAPSYRAFNNNVQNWVEERKKWKKEHNKW